MSFEKDILGHLNRIVYALFGAEEEWSHVPTWGSTTHTLLLFIHVVSGVDRCLSR